MVFGQSAPATTTANATDPAEPYQDAESTNAHSAGPFHKLCSHIYQSTIAVVLTALHLALANILMVMEVVGNAFHFCMHHLAADLGLGEPAAKRYQTSKDTFYDGAAVVMTGQVDDDDDSGDGTPGGGSLADEVTARLCQLGYSVVVVTEKPFGRIDRANRENHYSSSRPVTNATGSTKGGRVIRVKPRHLDETLQKLRSRQRIALAAVVHLSPANTSTTAAAPTAPTTTGNNQNNTTENRPSLTQATSENDRDSHPTQETSLPETNPNQQRPNSRLQPLSAPILQLVHRPPTVTTIAADGAVTTSTLIDPAWQAAATTAQRTLHHLHRTKGRLIFVNAPVGLVTRPEQRTPTNQVADLALELQNGLRQVGIRVSLVQPGDVRNVGATPSNITDCFAVPTTHAALAVEHAVGNSWPRSRYAVGWNVRARDMMNLVVGERMMDSVIGVVDNLRNKRRTNNEDGNSVEGTAMKSMEPPSLSTTDQPNGGDAALSNGNGYHQPGPALLAAAPQSQEDESEGEKDKNRAAVTNVSTPRHNDSNGNSNLISHNDAPVPPPNASATSPKTTPPVQKTINRKREKQTSAVMEPGDGFGAKWWQDRSPQPSTIHASSDEEGRPGKRKTELVKEKGKAARPRKLALAR